MKKTSFLNPPPVYIEISQSRLRAHRENDGMELPLERQPDGRLTASCKEQIIPALKSFLKAKNWQPRIGAICAIDARGVSLRRLSLPGGTRQEFHQRLLLQIESEFPLPPEELAWGCQQLGGVQSGNGVMAKQDLLVAAVKKQVLADYLEILRVCGTEPVFTLAALARSKLCPQPADSSLMLDIGDNQSELTIFEGGIPVTSRIIFWGSENSSSHSEAGLENLAQIIKGSSTGTKLFLSGNKISGDFPARLARSVGNFPQCKYLESANGDGGSAAISGLKKCVEEEGNPPLLIRVAQPGGAATDLAALDIKKWGTYIGLLAAALLCLPYVEAILLKPHLEKRVASFKAEAAHLPVIDNELDFLRGLKLSQPPYLDVLFVISQSVPRGTRLESLSLNSHGEISMRGAFRDGQQVADFRSKLIGSGFFTNVTVEEQVPTPDRQKVNVRIQAQEKPAAQLQALSASLAVDESAKDKKSLAAGAPPPGAPVPPPNSSPASRKEAR